MLGRLIQIDCLQGWRRQLFSRVLSRSTPSRLCLQRRTFLAFTLRTLPSLPKELFTVDLGVSLLIYFVGGDVGQGCVIQQSPFNYERLVALIFRPRFARLGEQILFVFGNLDGMIVLHRVQVVCTDCRLQRQLLGTCCRRESHVVLLILVSSRFGCILLCLTILACFKLLLDH